MTAWLHRHQLAALLGFVGLVMVTIGGARLLLPYFLPRSDDDDQESS